MKRSFTLPAALCSLLFAASLQAGKNLVFFGTQTKEKGSKGIYFSTLEDQEGEISEPALAVETPSATFLAAHPNGKFLYATNEAGTPENAGGAVSVFSIDPSGKLTLLNQVSSGGNGPAHIAVHKSGKMAVIANYGAGSVSAFTIGEDGKLGAAQTIPHTGKGADPARQSAPHAHGITFSPDDAQKAFFVPDLGTDTVHAYAIQPAAGKIAALPHLNITMKPGDGPRHMTFSADGRYAAVGNELSNTVTSYSYDVATGKFTPVVTVSSLKPDFKEKNSISEVFLHPNLRTFYVANRGDDSLGIFKVEGATGKLFAPTWVPCGGKNPRHFSVDDSGRWLFVSNQDDDNVTVFKIDKPSGKPTLPVHKVLKVITPMCAITVPLGK